MIRLGRFDKYGYMCTFSKGELARELVCMNNDYDKLEKENQKYKEVIDNLKDKLFNANSYRNYDDDEDDTKYTDLDIDELLDILKEVEHE